MLTSETTYSEGCALEELRCINCGKRTPVKFTPSLGLKHMASFEEALKKTLLLEGDSYVNDSADPGGETMYGISRRAHPEAWADGIPTLERASQIYKDHYWDPQYYTIESQEVASELMEFGVVAGKTASITLIQRALKESGFRGILVDGIFGPSTLYFINMADPEILLREFRIEQIIRFVKICEERPVLKKFFRGWLKRVLI